MFASSGEHLSKDVKKFDNRHAGA